MTPEEQKLQNRGKVQDALARISSMNPDQLIVCACGDNGSFALFKVTNDFPRECMMYTIIQHAIMAQTQKNMEPPKPVEPDPPSPAAEPFDRGLN